MCEEYFCYLVDIFRNKIGMNQIQPIRSTQNNIPVSPKLIVCIGLRSMGGKKNLLLIYMVFHDLLVTNW